MRRLTAKRGTVVFTLRATGGHPKGSQNGNDFSQGSGRISFDFLKKISAGGNPKAKGPRTLIASFLLSLNSKQEG